MAAVFRGVRDGIEAALDNQRRGKDQYTAADALSTAVGELFASEDCAAEAVGGEDGAAQKRAARGRGFGMLGGRGGALVTPWAAH
jgi:hypothetical protein